MEKKSSIFQLNACLQLQASPSITQPEVWSLMKYFPNSDTFKLSIMNGIVLIGPISFSSVSTLSDLIPGLVSVKSYGGTIDHHCRKLLLLTILLLLAI